jgi:hypothetical protein
LYGHRFQLYPETNGTKWPGGERKSLLCSCRLVHSQCRLYSQRRPHSQPRPHSPHRPHSQQTSLAADLAHSTDLAHSADLTHSAALLLALQFNISNSKCVHWVLYWQALLLAPQFNISNSKCVHCTVIPTLLTPSRKVSNKNSKIYKQAVSQNKMCFNPVQLCGSFQCTHNKNLSYAQNMH